MKPVKEGAWEIFRDEDDTCCPCPYCTEIREGFAPPVAEQQSPWLRRMGGMRAR